MTDKTYMVGDLADRLGATLAGPRDLEINGLNSLDQAQLGEMTFIGTPKHAHLWQNSLATAAIVTRNIEVAGHDPQQRALLHVEDADLALAEVLGLFAPDVEPEHAVLEPGIAPDATVHPTARVDGTACIMSGAHVGARTVIGARTILEPNVFIGPDCTVGDDCVFRSGAAIRHNCHLGHRVSIYANAVIGSDGFGYRPDGKGGLVKMPHIGIVELHDDVEIGACATVDRGKFGKTVIGAHTKLDNHVQVGHNVRIGRGCVLASQCGVAGSSVLGDFVQLGGQAGIADHLRLGNGVRVAAQSGVGQDIEDGLAIAGSPAVGLRSFWRMWSAVHKLTGIKELRFRQ